MFRVQITIKSAALVLAGVGLLAAGAPRAGAQPTALPGPAPGFVEERIGALEIAAGGEVRHRVSARSGAVTFVGAPRGKAFPARGHDAESRARSFLTAEAGLLGLDRAGGLAVARVQPPDRVGLERVRFRQEVGGVPVAGGEVSVHLRGAGVAVVVNRAAAGVGSLDTRPGLGAGQARLLARQAVAGRQGKVEGLSFSTPRLEILDRAHLGGPPAPVRLAWFVEARSLDRREFVWVDADSGVTLLRFSQLPHARDRRVYDASGAAGVLPGTLVRSEGEGVTGDTDTDDAYDFAGDTYDYFAATHGRDSYDDAGATLHSTVHYCPSGGPCPYANAFWNGAQMVYGDGFPAADDVVAHELTHAVTSATADLFYYMQSGALNESFSDIFGETVDLINGAGNDAAAERWELGEDLPSIGAIRNLMTPGSYGDPADTGDSDYVCQDPGTDAGGVHSNSGVPNHAFALMVDGGSHNGVTVGGIGLHEAGRIQYRTLTQYLLSSSDFGDTAAALEQSCLDLVGTSGISAADCDEVANAIAAVELDEPPTCGTTPSPALCPSGYERQDLFYEDFEELAGGQVNDPALLSRWTAATLYGSGNHWSSCCLGPFASSGTGNAWGYNLAATRDSALTMANDVLIPAAGAAAQFEHSFGFENSTSLATGVTTYWDGGVLEYSTDGGATWADAGGLVAAGQGYTGDIHPDYNPLGGRTAFVGDSYGYTGTQLDLTAFSGQAVRLRFRIGTDNVVTDYGWFLDDFRIYTCEAPAPCEDPILVLTQGTVTTTVQHENCNAIHAGDGYEVTAGGHLTLTAPRVELGNGFSVASGAGLVVGAPD